jgi:hypothetical protein
MTHDRHHRPDFQVTLTGLEMEILVSALFMTELYTWRSKHSAFRNARKWEAKISQKILRRLRDRRARARATASPADRLPREARRAFVSGLEETVPFSNVERTLMVLALRQCHVEFAAPIDWAEFCVAAPGEVSLLGGAPDDLLALAAKLEGARTPPPARRRRATKP